VRLEAAKPRTLLALLLIRRSDVHRDVLVDALWGEGAPAGARNTLQVYVSRLRSKLGADAITTTSSGYRLERGEVDADRFERLFEQGAFAEALGLWRGPAFGDLRYEAFVQAEAGRLEELRLACVEGRIDSELEQCRHGALVGELEALVVEHPLRERLRGQLIVALYRSGRQAEALAQYQATRKMLSEELGLDPSPELRELERMILAHDRRLALPGLAAEGRPEIADGSQPTASEVREERKVVSVLFCDLIELTPVEGEDPEDVQARVQSWHQRLRSEVDSFGGRTERVAGEGLLAVFGAPRAHEDDPERAVKAALRMVEAVEGINQDHPERRLEVRVGVSTGEVVVEGDGMISGRVVTTPALITSALSASGVIVSEETFRSTKRFFVYRQLPPTELKNRQVASVALYRAVEPRARLLTGSTVEEIGSFVGREREQHLLQAVFERCTRESQPQLVTLVGEPGIGKTRLCAEFGSWLGKRSEIVRWRYGRCLPYGDGVTFWALGEIIKTHAGILESDAAEAATSKLGATLPERPDRAWMLQRLLPLIGVEPTSTAGREELFAAWTAFLESIAEQTPTVLVVEDLHWADDALIAFLEQLADQTKRIPLLLLTTGRPELYDRHLDWAAGVRTATKIDLAKLSGTETAELVARLVSHELAPEQQEAVVKRAGGNPLHARELVRLLAERGPSVGGDAQAIPDSIQALIQARLDTLTPERKSLLQDAAVVGNVFWAGAAAEIAGRDPHEVDLVLHELSRRGLVHPARSSSMEAEAEYAFSHELIRDVAYGQIRRAERVRRHRAAAVWIERAGRRPEDLVEVAAHHYATALGLARASGQVEQARELEGPTLRCLILAGKQALDLDTQVALTSFERALELAPVGHPARRDALIGFGTAANNVSRFEEASEAAEEAIDLSQTAGDRAAAARAMMILAGALSRLGDKARRNEAYAAAVDLLEQLPPGPDLVEALARRSVWGEGLMGRPISALETAERAVALSRDLGHYRGKALFARACARSMLGDARGLADFRQAIAAATEAGLGDDGAIAHSNLAWSEGMFNGPTAALEVLDDGIAYAQPRGLSLVVSHMQLSRLHYLFQRGEWDEVLEVATGYDREEEDDQDRFWGRAFRLKILGDRGQGAQVSDSLMWLELTGRRFGEPQYVFAGLAVAAFIRAGLEQSEAAAALLTEIDTDPRFRDEGLSYPVWLPDLVRTALLLGRRALAGRLVAGVEPRHPRTQHALVATNAALIEARGERRAAADGYADAAQRWYAFGDVHEHAYALLGQGRCLTSLGRPEAAEPLAQARELFQAMGCRPALAETDSLLADATTLAF
jgi:DNA-binding SARP family transcriptional activator/tetratricopeptide (TPR) repeat protein